MRNLGFMAKLSPNRVSLPLCVKKNNGGVIRRIKFLYIYLHTFEMPDGCITASFAAPGHLVVRYGCRNFSYIRVL